MNTFTRLQKRHEELLTNQDRGDNSDSLLKEVQDYVREVVSESTHVTDFTQREQLTENLRYWAKYLFEHTGQYPRVELRPVLYQEKTEDSKQENSTTNMEPVENKKIWLLLGIILFLLVVYGFYFISARNTESLTSATETAIAIESINATETAVAGITTDQNTPSPSSTPTPSLTPSPTQTPTLSPTPAPSETPTPDFSGISVRLLEPQNGDQVEPLITVRGDYTNLRAGWSIHVLLQPVSQGGKLFPTEDYFLVPSSQASGTWEIEVQLGSGTDLQTPERYILEAIISTSDAGRAYLEGVSETGIDQLPSEFLTFPQLTTINRAAYDEIDEIRIVYYGLNSTGDSYEIYSMRTDGTDIRQLTYTADVSETAPSLSPNGDKLAFIQIIPGDRWLYSLWTMDGSGKNRTLLADNIRTEISPIPVPVWSPDSKYIAYNSQVQNSAGIWEYQIMLYDLTNGNISQLTESVNGATYPSWMPDGQTLIYRERFGIYSINVTTRERAAVFNDPIANETILSVSPDGTKLAMTYFIDTSTTIGNRDIYVLEIETDNLQRMTTHEGLDWLPNWHPDGATIYFESYRETGRAGIWAIEADGTNERRISARENLASSPFVGWMRAYLPREP